jgi:cystathionine beta-lyase
MTDVLPSSPAASVVSTTPRRYRFATEVVTVDNSDDPHNAASVPIYQTATFKQKGATGSGEYDYSRSGNPTRTHVGKCLVIR